MISLLDRSQGWWLQAAFGAAFAGYFLFLYSIKSLVFPKLVLVVFITGIILRGLFLFDGPKLSDDYFRFLWDGTITATGGNPFATQPACMESNELLDVFDEAKFNSLPGGQLNSRDFHSVYPPVNQSIFFLAYRFSGGDYPLMIIVLKAILFIFEIISFFLLIRILNARKVNTLWAGMYWLNPLVIGELVGNLHFEAVAISFVLLTIYLIEQNKLLLSSLPLALAIATKLTPILLLGVALRKIPFKKHLFFGILTCAIVFGLFSIWMNGEYFLNFLSSVRLYVHWFEFNASLYYIAMEIYLMNKASNLVGLYNFWLPIIFSAIILLLNLLPKKYDLIERFFLVLLVYFVLSKVIHPWYITPLIALSPLVRWKVVLLWSYLICLSYWSYTGGIYLENKWIVLVSYLMLAGYFFWEWKKKRDAPGSSLFDGIKK